LTEKRFTFDIDNENGYNEEPYFCNGIDSFYVNNADEMELFIKEINELEEENKGFKIDGEFKNKEYSKLLDSFMELKKKYQGIKKENKELKAKVDDKEVAVEVECEKLMQKVFEVIDKSLEKDKQDYEMTYEDYLNGRIEALEELKKELIMND